MPVVSFSNRDLLRGTIVEPAWYRMRIESVGEELSKDEKSTNYPVEGTILFNGDNGNVNFKDVPITWNFNSKAMGFSKGFLISLGVELKADTRYELKAAEGKELDVFVENGVWQNRPVNRVEHKYRPINPEVVAVG